MIYYSEMEKEIGILRAKIAAAEAKLQRIMEWAKGRCECCGNLKCKANRKRATDLHCGGCNWTPPKAWEGE